MKDFEKDKDLREQVKIGIEEDLEFNHLKKINKKINLLRYILFFIIFIIFTILLIFFFRYNKINNILNKSYDKIKIASKSNNYQLIVQDKEITYSTNETLQTETKIFYKDGKCKKEWRVTDDYSFKEIPYFNTYYYSTNSSYNITIFHNSKLIEDSNYPVANMLDRNHFLIDSTIYSYSQLKGFYSIFQKVGLNVKTDYFNNEECYVIREESENNGYHETWISKESYLVIRDISSSNAHYNEKIYSLVLDQVTDEDVDYSNIADIYSDYEIKLGGKN